MKVILKKKFLYFTSLFRNFFPRQEKKKISTNVQFIETFLSSEFDNIREINFPLLFIINYNQLIEFC